MRVSIAWVGFMGSKSRRGEASSMAVRVARVSALAAALGLALALSSSCSALDAQSDLGGQDSNGGGGGSGGATSTSGTSATSATGEFDFDGGLSGSGSGGAPPTCMPGGPDDDADKDGFTPNQGDCDDCDPYSNPNAVEVIAPSGTKPKDENCNGQIDEPPPPTCDEGLDLADLDPLNAARAVDLCKQSSGLKDWGIVEAKWVMADGSPPPPDNLPNFHLGHGLLSAFGANVKVRHGERMLGLSSGTARQPTDPGYEDVSGFGKGYGSKSPQGFPKESPACLGTLTGQPKDPTGVELKIRVPSNAHGFSFDFDFFTYEWPEYICDIYNDFFVAILSPMPKGKTDGNISFDSQGNPVSVNNAFLEVCGCEGNPPLPCRGGTKTFTCSLGNTDLIGTGFGFDSSMKMEDHGSTGWLVTKTPIAPGSEITIRWAVYDSGDGILDTTTLVDHWQWIAKAGITVGTTPVPR
jgi:hypothetical protein